MINLQKLSKFLVLIPFLILILPTFSSIDRISDQYFYLSIYIVVSFIWVLATNYTSDIINRIIYFFKTPQVIGYLGFILFCFVSIYFAENKTESIVTLSQLLTIFFTFLIILFLSKSINQPIHFLFQCFYVILILELVVCLVPLYQDIQNFQIEGRSMRYIGLMSNINITSFSLLYKIPVLLYFIEKHTSKISRLFNYIIFFNLILVVLILGSRASFIAILFFGIFWVYEQISSLKNKNYKSKPLILIGLIIAAIVFNQYISNKSGGRSDLIKRTESITLINSDSSIKQRLSYYQASIDFIRENPFFGIGIGNWKVNSIEKVKGQINSYVVPYTSHNDFLQVFSEIGIFGFFCFASIFITTFILIFKNWKFITYRIILVFFAIYCIDAFFNFPTFRPSGHLQFTFYLAILILLIKNNENE